MSFRLLTHRLFKHGRHLLYNYCTKRDIHINILERRNIRGLSRNIGITKKDGLQKLHETVFRDNTFFRIGQHARRLFVDNVLNRVTPIYSADLRNEATKKFLFGDSAPLFALIGVCLASGTGILTKDDELEGVCWEIREAVSRLHDKSNFGRENVKDNVELGLDKLNIGSPIANGSMGVVYAAALKDVKNEVANLSDSNEYDSDASSTQSTMEVASPIRNDNRFIHNFGSSLENPHFLHKQTMPSIQEHDKTTAVNRVLKSHRKVEFISKPEINYPSHIAENFSNGSSLSNSMENISLAANVKNDDDGDDLTKYPLALKMMFNYDAQSNAMAILRAMYKETIPAVNKYNNPDADGWEKLLMEQTVNLPSHPNIVLMVGVFCAQVPNLVQSSSLYPMALPPRINPSGFGRNMSLFLLMKRYDFSLSEYLKQSFGITMRTRILLFTQLLEGVAHLYRHGVAHRDLKADNILIDLNGNDLHPILVLSDFGCCIADKKHGLSLPYSSMDMDKGGNRSLMAPEIITKMPGTFSVLDYSKSDLWACGAIAYDIFGSKNPFWAQTNDVNNATETQMPILKNVSYRDEDLPALDHGVHPTVRKLIANILQRNPNRRLSPDIAANVMQLVLWAPSAWLKSTTTVSSPEILQWLLSLTTKILYEARLGSYTKKTDPTDTFGLRHIQSHRTYTEYLLLSSFLIRAQLQQIKSALEWIQHTVEFN